MLRAFASLSVAAVLMACPAGGQQPVSFPAVGGGVSASAFDVRGWQVTLSQARLGFGPAYFCLSRADNPDLCSQPASELATTATVDALNPDEQALGTVEGVASTLASVQFDCAITWLTTQRAPSPRSGAPNGHSAVLEGDARKDGNTIHFTANLDLLPYAQGTRAIQGMPVSADVTADTRKMVVHVDPQAWLAQVDFDGVLRAHFQDGDGGVADAGGTPVDIRVEFLPGSRPHNALVFQMTTNARPTFRWLGSEEK